MVLFLGDRSTPQILTPHVYEVVYVTDPVSDIKGKAPIAAPISGFKPPAAVTPGLIAGRMPDTAVYRAWVLCVVLFTSLRCFIGSFSCCKDRVVF